MIRQVTIIGLGLIGGSIAAALKNSGFCEKLAGYDIHLDNVTQAIQKGFITAGKEDIITAIADAELIIIAVPVGQTAAIFQAIATHATKQTLIMDVGSTKASIVAEAEQLLSPTQFSQYVPTHPIAGSEKSGIAAANPQLFEQRSVIITPHPHTASQAIATVSALWRQLGAKVKIVDAAYHDEVLALTSHLPQLLAYTYMEFLARQQNYPELLDFAGSGLRDFTRIAASQPDIWLDICQQNRSAILSALNDFKHSLQQLTTALQNDDMKILETFFATARQARLKLS